MKEDLRGEKRRRGGEGGRREEGPCTAGVLSDGTLSIKQLAFFRLDHSGQPKLTTLDMSKHPAYRFLTRFDDPGWRGHLAALKPIGLNAVLRSTCRRRWVNR